MLDGGNWQIQTDHIYGAKTNDELLRRFHDVCKSLDLKFVNYLSGAIHGASDDNPFRLISFPVEWIIHYQENGYSSIDPAINLSFGTTLPINWENIPRRGKRVKELFKDAQKFNIGTTGMTIPIYGPTGFAAMVTVTSDMEVNAWNLHARKIESFLMHLSYKVHKRCLELNGNRYQRVDNKSLSLMEVSCLRWIAEGKTMQQAAETMGLGERTVRMHLSSARNKLEAENTVQAVSMMIRGGLL